MNVKQPPYDIKSNGTDETATMQRIINDFRNGCTLIIPDTVIITSIVFPSTFKGEVIGAGTLNALPNTIIEKWSIFPIYQILNSK